MDMMLFWTAFGAIGTTVGSIATAVAVMIALKPYKKKLFVQFGLRGTDDGSEYSICCYNTGDNLYQSSIRIAYQGKIVIDCINFEMPVLIPTNTKYEYLLDDKELNFIKYHLLQNKTYI